MARMITSLAASASDGQALRAISQVPAVWSAAPMHVVHFVAGRQAFWDAPMATMITSQAAPVTDRQPLPAISLVRAGCLQPPGDGSDGTEAYRGWRGCLFGG